MGKPRIKLLIFIAFLLIYNNVFSVKEINQFKPYVEAAKNNPKYANDKAKSSMPKKSRKRSRPIKQEKLGQECSICQNKFAQASFHQLTCRHEFCKNCVARYLATQYRNNVVPTCPTCNKIFVAAEYDKLMEVAQDSASNLKIRYASQEFLFRHENRNYKTVQNTSHTPFDTKQALKILAIPIGLAGYALYQFCKNKKNPIEQPIDKVKETESGWISKKYCAIKESVTQNKSDILISAFIGIGLFALLNHQSVNLAPSINAFVYKKLSQKYRNIINSLSRNIFLRPIKDEFDNGHLINAGLSLTAGLLVTYINKVLRGNQIKSRTRPQLIIRK